jgi:oligoribonuclease (3'-5' exoribonuclease)
MENNRQVCFINIVTDTNLQALSSARNMVWSTHQEFKAEISDKMVKQKNPKGLWDYGIV